MKKLIALGLVVAALAIRANPVTIVFTNPNNVTNLGVNIYCTTNLSTPTNQWPLFAYIPNSPPGTNTYATNLPPANYYFIAAFTNSSWQVQTFFSNGAATPPLPTNLVANLGILFQ